MRMCVYIYICIYISSHGASMHLGAYASMRRCIYASMHLCLYALMRPSMHLCIYASMHLCIYASTHAYAPMHLCIYASMHLRIYASMHDCARCSWSFSYIRMYICLICVWCEFRMFFPYSVHTMFTCVRICCSYHVPTVSTWFA